MSFDTLDDVPDEEASRESADASLDDTAADDVPGAVLYDEQVQPEYGIIGFTLRELIIVGAWLVLFIVSFFPLASGYSSSIWGSGISWILTVGVPTVAVFLIVLRRLSPDGIRRVGSLGIDQFASVAVSVAAVCWAQLLWLQISTTIDTGVFVIGWPVIVAQLATLALVAVTVAARLLPQVREDFEGRRETLAHRNANPVRPVIARPRVVTPAPEAEAEADAPDEESDADQSPDGGAADQADIPVTPVQQDDATPAGDDEVPVEIYNTGAVDALRDIFASDGVTTPIALPSSDTGTIQAAPLRRDRSEPSRTRSEAEPFWILARTERDVFDDLGQPLFRIGPTDWTLVIEDRGGAFVVRHEDGRIGYLHDLSDITRG